MDVIPTGSTTRLEEEKFQSDWKTVKEQLIPD